MAFLRQQLDWQLQAALCAKQLPLQGLQASLRAVEGEEAVGRLDVFYVSGMIFGMVRANEVVDEGLWPLHITGGCFQDTNQDKEEYGIPL